MTWDSVGIYLAPFKRSKRCSSCGIELDHHSGLALKKERSIFTYIHQFVPIDLHVDISEGDAWPGLIFTLKRLNLWEEPVYPGQFFSIFPAFPMEPPVFVAMSFDRRFQPRWDNVIVPAIRDVGLEPDRVDAAKFSDSILTKILSGIGQATLVFADVSEIDGVRNANVMYEVGIAHAVRQPQEVILFRSDSSKLPFDVSNIRVNSYSPDKNPVAARGAIYEALQDSLTELDLTRSLAVQGALASLDHVSASFLREAVLKGQVEQPLGTGAQETLENAWKREAVVRLLDLGLFEAKVPDLHKLLKEAPNPITSLIELPGGQGTYEITPLGEAACEAREKRSGIRAAAEDPETRSKMLPMLEQKLSQHVEQTKDKSPDSSTNR